MFNVKVFKSPGGGRGLGQGGGRGLGRGSGQGLGRGSGQGLGRGGGLGRNQGGAFGPGGYCVCAKCGEKIPHQQGTKCTDIKCPKCGHTMVREELLRNKK